MYYYKTRTWFAPVNTVTRFAIHEHRLIKIYFNNGTWDIIGDTLQVLDENGKIIKTYDTLGNVDSENIQNHFESIITDFIQINKPIKIY